MIENIQMTALLLLGSTIFISKSGLVDERYELIGGVILIVFFVALVGSTLARIWI